MCASIDMNKLRYAVLAVFILSISLLIPFLFFPRRPKGCVIDLSERIIAIATVKRDIFIETISRSGIIEYDSLLDVPSVEVEIDQLYRSRISVGLKATSILNNKEYKLLITRIDPDTIGGRFYVI